MTPASKKAITTHFSQARTALINAKAAQAAEERQSWATLARSEIELCRFYMLWPASEPEYGELP